MLVYSPVAVAADPLAARRLLFGARVVLRHHLGVTVHLVDRPVDRDLVC